MRVFEPLQADDPRQIGPYWIQTRLGSGGMGRIYLGRSRTGRAVAVKVIRAELAEDPGFLRRFAREVALARTVSGFFTAAVVDADPTGSPPWLATAYMPGLSLEAAIEQHGPWPEASLRALGAGLAEALQSIHTAGVIHRDLKPSNVLLTGDGPRLIDFGISVALDGSRLTQTGSLVGTPGFMSPEQLTGAPVGPASDVFCLGALLAYTATGTGPFGIGSWQVLWYRIVHEEPDLTALPDGLRPLVKRCLAKQPEQRPSTATLLEELTRTGTDGTVVTELFTGAAWLPHPVGDALRDDVAAPPPWTGTSDHETPAPPSRAPGDPDRADRPPTSSDDGEDVRATEIPPAVVAVPGLPAVPTRVDPADGVPSGEVPAARRARISRRQAVFALAGVGAAVAGFTGWRLLDTSAEKSLPGASPEKLRWTFTVSGEGVDVPPPAAVSSGGVDASQPATTRGRGTDISPPSVVGGVVLIASRSARSHGGKLHGIDAMTGRRLWEYIGDLSSTLSPPAVADGVVYIGAVGKLYAIDAMTGRRLWEYTGDKSLFSAPSLAVGDGVVCTGGFLGEAQAIDTATRKKRWTYPIDGLLLQPPVIAEETVYIPELKGKLHAVDTTTGKARWSISASLSPLRAPVVADGTLYLAGIGTLQAIDTATGKQRWTSDASSLDSPAVAGGTLYVAGIRGIQAIDTATGKQRWTSDAGGVPGKPRQAVLGPPAVADGTLYVGDSAGALHAIDAATGQQRWSVSTGETALESVAVSGKVAYVTSRDGKLHAVTA
ncbi:PQQ-binding-like beta-propeller repeat protein [Rhizohabitans arisaemae]|uniref:serine/threonine-protein kinase n=1 Tax=Rhizohabitans arisaemae TaxID=2720610 RepID=UPI0024B12E13|nr:serine/threonine-protein kinase [Rhizohabitans arisaemae]